MDKTKFFTEQVTSGSRGEASDEDMQCEMTDFGAEEMPDDRTFFMPEGGGGFIGRAKRRRFGDPAHRLPTVGHEHQTEHVLIDYRGSS